MSPLVFILWIIVSGPAISSQQAALFATEAACEAAKKAMLSKIPSRLSVVAECLPYGDK